MEALQPIFSYLGPALNIASSAVGLGKQLFGGNGGSDKAAAAVPATTMPAIGPTAPSVAPGTSQDDYRRQQSAYYNQMFSGLGIGGELPADIQQTIERQASLIG